MSNIITDIENKGTYRRTVKVCKTFIRRFDSDPRLQHFLVFPTCKPHLQARSASPETRRSAGESWIKLGSAQPEACAVA
jgi:hypothetical protein